jgi:hypothetical protein
MTYVLKTLKMRHQRKRDFTVQDFEAHLAAGNAMILIYDTKKNGSHAVFVDAMNETHYRAWNRRKGSEPWVEKSYLQNAIARSRKKKHLYAFLFAKPQVQLTIKS